MSDVKKVVLAYSGGLDTSVILKWLQDVYQCEIVTFTADLGQGEELEPARGKALKMGIQPDNIFIEDLREEFVRDFVFPMFREATGARFVNEELCNGCKLCIKACPLEPSRINFNSLKKKAVMCDLCKDRPEGPVCVQMCPTMCLELKAY